MIVIIATTRSRHHHRHHRSITMVTACMVVVLLGCQITTVTSLETKNRKLEFKDVPRETHDKVRTTSSSSPEVDESLNNLKFKVVNVQLPPIQPSQEHVGHWDNRAGTVTTFNSQPMSNLQINNNGFQQGNASAGDDWRNNRRWNQPIDQGGSWDVRPHPSPEPRVDREVRKDVEWNYNANYYSLKASSDSRFLIRYAPPAALGSPWPMPQIYNPSLAVYSIDPTTIQLDVTINSRKYKHNLQSVGGKDFYDDRDSKSCSVLDFNLDRMKKLAFGGRWDKQKLKVEGDEYSQQPPEHPSIHSAVKQLDVKIVKPCEREPHLHMNESYTLKVTSMSILIQSEEVWGAVRGLETLAQLIYQKDNDPFRYYINMTLIIDFPRFKHRGILLDTARHFLDVSTLLENLESMAHNKFNVFHWHIVDDQSFPFKSYSYPNLTMQGAYDYETHVYSHEDVGLIIEQARLRGIRVIPEFDTPGHTFSWGFGQSHLLTPCHNYGSGEFNGLYGPINPILRKNYNFLRVFFKEVMSVFKDKYLHLGGDEVPFECWLSNPQIKKFMKKNAITDIKHILSFYARQLLSLISTNANDLKRTTGSIVWQEMFDNDVELPKDTIIQVWSGDSYDLERITRMGYGVLFSTCWYLDYIQYGQDWDKYYICDHIANLYMKNESLFYGGEVCLWAEYTDDSDILTRLWPRAAAAAERLWSDKSINNLYRAAPRLENQRCRMMERGLKVGVLSGPSHCQKNRMKRKQRAGGNNPSKISKDNPQSIDLPNVDKKDENYVQDGNADKRKLNRYSDNNGEVLQRHPRNQMNSGVVKEKPVSSVFSSLSSITIYLMICFSLFVMFVLHKKKFFKLPTPTSFILARNNRAFVVCLILLTASFIWLQHVRFFTSTNPSKTGQ